MSKKFGILPTATDLGPNRGIPRYNGDIGLHHEYETRAKAYAATKKEDDQILVGPEPFSALIDQAWARVKDLDPSQFRVRGGHLLLFNLLRPDFSKYPHIQAGEAVEEFFYGLTREKGEESSKHCLRYNTGLTKMLTQVRMEEDREAEADFQKAKHDYTVETFEYRQEIVDYRDRLAQAEALADLDGHGIVHLDALGPEPVRPEAPVRKPNSAFSQPSSISSRMCLRKHGYMKDQRGSIYRTVGSWKLQDLQECVKMSEQEVAGPARATQGGCLGDHLPLTDVESTSPSEEPAAPSWDDEPWYGDGDG